MDLKPALGFTSVASRLSFAFTGFCLFLNSTSELHSHPLDNWHLRYTNAAISRLNGIVYGEGIFVTVGSGGVILTSDTGASWAGQVSGSSQSLNHVTWGNGIFVAVGEAGTILSSTDGKNWVTRFCSGVSNTIAAVEFGMGRFVATADKLAATSVDGTNWTAFNTCGTYNKDIISHGNGLFLLGSSAGTNCASADGTNWFFLPSGSPESLYTTCFGKGMFVAIDILNDSFISLDGTNWTQRNQINLVRPTQIAVGGGHFVTVGGGPILFSKDAENWSTSSNGYIYVGWGAAYGRATFVAVGTAGKIIQSDLLLTLETKNPGVLSISGIPGAVCSIETTSTPHLTNSWQSLTNVILTVSPYTWTDPAPPVSPRRFYRSVMFP